MPKSTRNEAVSPRHASARSTGEDTTRKVLKRLGRIFVALLHSGARGLTPGLTIAVMGMALVFAYTIPVCWYCAAKSAPPGRVADGAVESPSLPSPEPGNIVGDNRQ
jgi:hypothetical protein